jgi:hypothetical protein
MTTENAQSVADVEHLPEASFGFGVALIGLAGLNTDPLSDIWGLRPLLEDAADKYPGAKASFFGWDNAVFERDLLPILQTNTTVILAGHSFGGAKAKQWGEDINKALQNSTLKQKPKLYGLFFDPAPNILLGQSCDWQTAVASPQHRWHAPAPFNFSVLYHQTNEKLIPGIGVCGVPFYPAKNVINYNVTKLGLYHCHMVGDSRIQAVSAAWLDIWLTGPSDTSSAAVTNFARTVEVD